MDAVNWINFACYVVMLALCIVMAKRGWWIPSIVLGSLALHGLAFNAAYIYRDMTWASCPPVCGLQHWSSILRTHSLFAILTAILDRLMLSRRHGL